MPLHFGVDIDGVLAHHLPAMLDVVLEVTGKTLLADEVKDYFFAGLVAREDMERVFWRCMETALDLPLVPEAQLINDLPGQVTIVTHRDEDQAGPTTREWLARHGLRYDGLVFTKGRKSLCGCFDYFVDDAAHNALDLAQAGVMTFLMEQPYNREFDFGEHAERVVRVGGWEEIRLFLCERELWPPDRLVS